MRITPALLASIGTLIVLPGSSLAEVQPPTFRETADWIILSGSRDSDKVTLPWSFAIKKSSVKSVTISVDRISTQDLEVYKTKRFDSPEIQQLPAIITITTDGLMADGANMGYQITGLTHGTAPAMLEKILGATSNAEKKSAEQNMNGKPSEAHQLPQSPTITKEQALSRVEEKAKELRIPIESRNPKIETNDTTFRITYPAPENMRGGDWIFVVDRNTGDFADIKIHR